MARQPKPEWQPADTAPHNQTGLVCYTSRYGRQRIARGVYVPPLTVVYDGDEEWGNYDGATDEYYLPDGWYERLDNGEYDYFVIDGTVTHYMPLPSIPEVHDGTPTHP